MIFKPELAEKVMRGEKTVTRRLVQEDNPRSPWSPERAPKMVGTRRAVIPGRGKHGIGFVNVLSVERELFNPLGISWDEARAEGFHDASEFRLTWAALHKSVEPVDVWRVAFKVCPTSHTPKEER